MAEAPLFARASGSTGEASLPQHGAGASLQSARFLRIARKGGAAQADVFPVNPTARQGAEDDVFLLPGKLGLKAGERAEVVAAPASAWAYRWAQLKTTNGLLVLAVLGVALLSGGIDLALFIGKRPDWVLWTFKAATLDAMAAFSLLCKLVSAVLAFLLALWFKK